jgi:Mn-dependent DtxR family transcriptional regulator
MCRWLLRTRDLTDGDELFITQEFFAQMVGVRRPSLSLAANELQQKGFIKYARGRMTILDRGGLEKLTCECYRKVRDLY